MWNQADAPIKISDQPALGDAVFVMDPTHGPVTAERVLQLQILDLAKIVIDLRIEITHLETRVLELETQTPSAYWTRFTVWLWSLWPFRG